MGILKNIRQRRIEAKKEIKSAQARARAEVKERSRTQARREKLLTDLEKKIIKAEQKGLKDKRKHEAKLAKQEYKKIKAGKFNSQRVGRWISAGRLAIPVALPLIYRAITAGREEIVKARASRAGVSSGQLAQYSGHGATLKARIEGIRANLDASSLPSGYRADIADRLDTLVDAINNAELMTPNQRRRALSAINRDIDQAAQDIQTRLTQG